MRYEHTGLEFNQTDYTEQRKSQRREREREREDREKRRNPAVLIGRSAEHRGVGTRLADNRRRSGITVQPRLIVKRAASQDPNGKQMVAIVRLEQPFR